MLRRIAFPSIVVVLLLAALAAVAAVGTSSSPATVAVPEVHRSSDGGYFRFSVPLPKDAPTVPLALKAQVDSGDVFLLNAVMPTSSRPVDNDDEDQEEARRQITVTGRFEKPGSVQLTILAHPASESFKPLAKVKLQLPDNDQQNIAVRQAWAKQQQLALLGSDPKLTESYTQYWNLAVAPQYGLSAEFADFNTRQRREPPDLYSIFTGAAAIQESLQLELLGSEQRRQRDITTGDANQNVALASLNGPAVKSHPFQEMLKGREPQLPPLANLIPQDQYAVFFSDINKQIELADLMDEWGGNLLQQVEASAQDFHVRDKVSRQLCLENSLLTRWFGDRVIADMAFTGNDPFLKEGTGFTVLFSLKDVERFRKQIEKRYSEAAKNYGAKQSTFSIEGQTGFSAVSPDRSISSHTLIIGNNAIVSNSLPALQRILAVSAKRVPALAQADDFRYMRTIFPQNAQEEDIFIYLSNPHIRSLVSPRWKIGEARRMRCSTNMSLIANARLWFKAEKRREPAMEELKSGGYLGKADLACPDHGSYRIDKNGQPYCSLHNRQGLLTPVDEIPLEQVTPQEAAQYKGFVENYNRYWTQFFDPIGIRIKMGKDIRIQTCILPLIENSWYDGLAAFSGKRPGNLTESLLLPRTIMSLRGHFSPEWLQKSELNRLGERSHLDLSWLGDELSLNLCDGQVLFSAGGQAAGLLGRGMGRSSLEPLMIGYVASAINLPTYLGVKVTDPKKAEQMIPVLFRSLAPGHGDDFSVETYSIEQHNGRPLYVANFNIWLLKLRLYSAVIDDRLVVASRKDIVTELMDLSAKGETKKVVKHDGNLEMALYRSAFKQLEDTVNLGWQEDLRHACHKNIPLAAILLKNLGLPTASLEATTNALAGYQPYCPSGGRYTLDEKTGIVACSIHGTPWRPKQPPTADHSSKTLNLVNSLERVNARLSFTPEGLMTTVDIKRK